jgi:hypothetical protein
MDPQSAAHLIRILRSISIELRIANDLARETSDPYPDAPTENELDLRRERYREDTA